MDVNYGGVLKTYLTACVTLRHIHRDCPSDGQFADAMVTSAVVVFEKTANGRARGPHVIRRPPLRAVDQRIRPDRRLRSAAKWTIFPGVRNRGRTVLVRRDVGDLFTIKRGIATGPNSFFILDEGGSPAPWIPDTFLRPILPGARYLSDDVIAAGPDGHPRLKRSLVVIDSTFPKTPSASIIPTSGSISRRGGNGRPLGYWRAGARRGIRKSGASLRRSCVRTWAAAAQSHGNPFRFYWNQSWPWPPTST